MELPLAERELRRLAQLPSTFVVRAALGIISVPILTMFFLIGSVPGTMTPADEIASTLSSIGTLYLFFVSLLVPPFLTAGLIAAEKHERTLGTLLIADFSAQDVIFSKYVPVLLQVELLILGSLPVLSFATVLGGITPMNLLVAILLYSLTGLLVTSLGVLASTISRQPGGAMMLTIVVVGPLLLFDMARPLFSTWVSLDVPVLTPAVAALDEDLLSDVGHWGPSAALAVGFSLIFVASSILLLPQQLYQRAAKAPGALGRRFRRPINPLLRERGTSLIFSRAAGGLSSAVRSTLLKALFGLALALIAAIPCIGVVFVAAVVLYDVVATMDNAKRSGILDDIRLSAPDPRTFLWDIFYALWMRGWFYLPAIAMTGVFGTGYTMLVGVVFQTGAASFTSLESWVVGIVGIVSVLSVAITQLGLLTAIGCYQSGFGRNLRGQTATSVILYVVVNLVTAFIGSMAMLMVSFFEVFTNLMGDGYLGGLMVTLVLTLGMIAVYGLWTLGFYTSFKTRHLKYV